MVYAKLDLTGKSAVVMGGTSGIGRAISVGLAEGGANVAPTSRRAELIDEVAGEIEKLGRHSLRCASDVQNRASLEDLLAKAIEAFGKVDILVNCAGRTKRAPTLECSEEDWNAILGTNLTGALRVSQVFGRHMLERGYGRIIHIASIASFVGLHQVAAYAASKAGVASLTKSLAIEWGPQGVCVNAIAPGVFPTDLNRSLLNSPRGQEFLWRTPLKRYGSVNELVGAAIFLSSEAASFVNGEVLVVDGGLLASGVNQ